MGAGQFVRDEVNRLIDCPRRYNRWERDTGQSLGLAVPEGIPLKKWEALRPLWLSAANDQLLSEWQGLQQTATLGRQRVGRQPTNSCSCSAGALIRIMTMRPGVGYLRILRLIASDVDGAREVSIHFRGVERVARPYVYAMVPPGPYPGSPPPRIAPVLARLIWTPKSAESEDFAAFVARKDALMSTCSRWSAEGGVRGPAVDWFVFGRASRRSRPFDLNPRLVREQVHMLDRPDSRVKRLFGLLDAHADIGAREHASRCRVLVSSAQ